MSGTLTRPEPSAPRLLVTLATYNEVENLRPLVESILRYAPGASVLVIDDNSPDGTGRVADELCAALPGVHVIHRAGKLGLGTAIIEGMEFAIAGGYDYVLNLDADFSHPPRYIPAVVAGMRDHDVMIGSRYVPGGGVEDQQVRGVHGAEDHPPDRRRTRPRPDPPARLSPRRGRSADQRVPLKAVPVGREPRVRTATRAQDTSESMSGST